ncbi:membrane protein containing DUF1566 [Candidatus Magnetobacterium bavaricum]|uniref:Membrane protein containing DUF1566 n=1 Tax=Candidatus Magnetobacterium bavaricum TaxID=29290 RepID=A0A0F3GQL7_9BACT|nr:membrane protein containing DUF1566 [Candidatus Magnetobacterium bavaricum]
MGLLYPGIEYQSYWFLKKATIIVGGSMFLQNNNRTNMRYPRCGAFDVGVLVSSKKNMVNLRNLCIKGSRVSAGGLAGEVEEEAGHDFAAAGRTRPCHKTPSFFLALKYSLPLNVKKICVLLVLALIAVIGGMCINRVVYAGTVSLPQTGQVKSHDANTPQRDDGAIMAGVPWPKPRFTDNGNNTVTDNLTGLLWSKDAVVPTVGGCKGGLKNWKGALDYVACLNTAKYLGHSNWRLPNVNELASLVNAGASSASWLNTQGFTNVQANYYWSSTTYANASNTSVAWGVNMDSGDMISDVKSSYHHVWAVSGGDSVAPSSVWSTGQTASYVAGDDGALHKGVQWPELRFKDNDNNTVTDTLTQLLWVKDAGTPTVGSCKGSTNTWQGALDYVKCLNSASYLGYTNWRLPNKNELYSLVDHAMSSPALASGHPFKNVQSGTYWSSTTLPANTSYCWGVNIEDGKVNVSVKSINGYVWPVRSVGGGN